MFREETVLPLLNRANHPGWVPRHHSVSGYIPGDNCPSANHGIQADAYTGQQDGTAADPHIVLNCNRLCHLPALIAGFSLQVMGGSIHLYTRPDHHMVANAHLVAIQDGTLHVQKDILTDVNVLAVGAVEGWLDERAAADLAEQPPEKRVPLRLALHPVVDPE